MGGRYISLIKAFTINLPSWYSLPYISILAEAALKECTKGLPVRFELISAGTKPILLQP